MLPLESFAQHALYLKKKSFTEVHIKQKRKLCKKRCGHECDHGEIHK